MTLQMKTLALLPLGLILVACAGGPDVRIAVPTVVTQERVGISYRSVEVRDITLPTYAEQEDIFVETADGTVTASENIWADDPRRAATLEFSRALRAITGARVASEPWPFQDYADATVEVRVEEFVASVRGEFRVTGQYFVAPERGLGADRAGEFRIAVPLATDAEGAPNLGPASIAAARARAMSDLAELIAREGLR